MTGCKQPPSFRGESTSFGRAMSSSTLRSQLSHDAKGQGQKPRIRNDVMTEPKEDRHVVRTTKLIVVPKSLDH